MRKLANNTLGTQARIDGLIEIEDLTEELIKYERILDDIDSFKAPGAGSVAAKSGEVRSISITTNGTIETTTKQIPGAIQISQDEVNILRTLGLDRYEIQELNIPGRLTASQRQALINKNRAVIQDLTSSFSNQKFYELIQRLTSNGFKQIFEVGGKETLKLIIDIIELEKNGKVVNFDDWVKFIIRQNKSKDDLLNVIGELREAKRLAASYPEKSKVINIGGDARAVPDKYGNKPSTFDLTVEERNTRRVVSNVDVTTIGRLATETDQFTEAIGHAADKVIETTQGTVESTVRVELPQAKTSIGMDDGRLKFFGTDGRYTIMDISGTSRRIGRDSYEGEGDLLKDLVEHMSEQVVKAKKIDRLNIVDKSSGDLIAVIRNKNGIWILTRMR